MVAITTPVVPFGECFEVKAGMLSLQCNNSQLCDPLSERFGGELLTTGRYIIPALASCTFYQTANGLNFDSWFPTHQSAFKHSELLNSFLLLF